jgi:hypothetical protein
MVLRAVSEKEFLVNLCKILDLPAPLSPINMILSLYSLPQSLQTIKIHVGTRNVKIKQVAYPHRVKQPSYWSAELAKEAEKWSMALQEVLVN